MPGAILSAARTTARCESRSPPGGKKRFEIPSPCSTTQIADLQAANAALANQKRELQDIAATLESNLAEIRSRQRYQYVQQTYTSVPLRRAYVFRLLNESVQEVQAYSGSAAPPPHPPISLPNYLAPPPGNYRFLDQTYRLK